MLVIFRPVAEWSREARMIFNFAAEKRRQDRGNFVQPAIMSCRSCREDREAESMSFASGEWLLAWSERFFLCDPVEGMFDENARLVLRSCWFVYFWRANSGNNSVDSVFRSLRNGQFMESVSGG